MASERHTVTASRPSWSRLRLRQTAHLRDLVSETSFSAAQLIQPLFVVEDFSGSELIAGLGDNARHGTDAALETIARDLDAGVRHFMLFAVPATKQTRGLTFRHLASTVGAIKARFDDALHLWVDICLCSSTTHGHCALLDEHDGIDLGAAVRQPPPLPARRPIAP